MFIFVKYCLLSEKQPQYRVYTYKIAKKYYRNIGPLDVLQSYQFYLQNPNIRNKIMFDAENRREQSSKIVIDFRSQ